jgi:hypothetical protein
MSPSNQEPLKVQVIGHVNSNYPDSFRTRQDYLDDQRKAFWLFAMQIVTLIVAIGSMVGTYLQVAVALKDVGAQSCEKQATIPSQTQVPLAPVPLQPQIPSGAAKPTPRAASASGAAPQSTHP